MKHKLLSIILVAILLATVTAPAFAGSGSRDRFPGYGNYCGNSYGRNFTTYRSTEMGGKPGRMAWNWYGGGRSAWGFCP